MPDANRESIGDVDQYWRVHESHDEYIKDMKRLDLLLIDSIVARPDAVVADDAPEFVNPCSPAPKPNSKNPSEMDLQMDKLVQELLQRVSGGETSHGGYHPALATLSPRNDGLTQHEDDIPGLASALARVQSLDAQTCSAEEAMLVVNALLKRMPTDFKFNSYGHPLRSQCRSSDPCMCRSGRWYSS